MDTTNLALTEYYTVLIPERKNSALILIHGAEFKTLRI